MKTDFRRTKIIFTVGPATESEEMLEKLIRGGVDIARLNMAHANHDWVRSVMRRIGRAPDGTPVDIIAGAKITGRAGPWTLGLLDVQTDDSRSAPSGNLFVGRIAREGSCRHPTADGPISGNTVIGWAIT
ncbi:MAG: hypothetical protein RIS54_973 [Verrucomicrobiota bacterium]|jgi:hypothetical protein